MVFEEKLLNKLFNLKGDLCSGGKSYFDFETQGPFGYAIIKLNGNKAELYSRPHEKFDDVFESVKKLSHEDIVTLQNKGYEW